jgi:hypothetical protein
VPSWFVQLSVTANQKNLSASHESSDGLPVKFFDG